MKRPVIVEKIDPETGHSLPEPFAGTLGAYEGRDIGAHFELSQFGAHAETLLAGSQSALRHWHSHSDELVYVLGGELTLICDDGEYALSAGMAVGFKAGDQNGHHLINNSSSAATFLVVGLRSSDDKVFYPDDDLQWLKQDGHWFPADEGGNKY